MAEIYIEKPEVTGVPTKVITGLLKYGRARCLAVWLLLLTYDDGAEDGAYASDIFPNLKGLIMYHCGLSEKLYIEIMSGLERSRLIDTSADRLVVLSGENYIDDPTLP